MNIPPTGPISFSAINTLFKRTSTSLLRLGGADLRTLAQKDSGPISISDLRNTIPGAPIIVAGSYAEIAPNGATRVVSFPAGIQSGDLILVGVIKGSVTELPSGFTQGPGILNLYTTAYRVIGSEVSGLSWGTGSSGSYATTAILIKGTLPS